MRYHVMLEVEAVKLNEQDKRLLPNTQYFTGIL